jgi:hypothetical protein
MSAFLSAQRSLLLTASAAAEVYPKTGRAQATAGHRVSGGQDCENASKYDPT